MKIKEDVNPKGIKIYFYEDEHVYETDSCDSFVSVTTYIDKFFPEFERDRISEAYAKKHGMRQSDVLRDWDNKANVASQVGANVHSYCERRILGKRRSSAQLDIEKKLFVSADKAIDGLNKKYELVSAEKIIFSEKRKLAGTIDLIMRKRDDGKLYIMDWKTNKSLDKENKYNKFGFDPISHVDDNNFYHYALQLSFYKNLLLEEGYFDEEMELRIIHLKPEKPLWIEVPDMTEEYKKMVDFNFEEQQKLIDEHSLRIKKIKKDLRRINKKFNS